jgi:transposase
VAQCIDITLDDLRQVRERIDHRCLVDGDWPLFGAFVSNTIVREEAKCDRLRAKVAAAKAEAAAAEAIKAAADVATVAKVDTIPPCGFECANDGEIIDVEHTVIGGGDGADEGNPAGGASVDGKPTTSSTSDPDGKTGKKKAKGHGRNGSAAYTGAKTFFHALMTGIIGSICMLCNSDRMTRHRDHVTIRIVGQPMFGAERHLAEQARCRTCGRVVSALPANILVGIGKAVTYEWSACAMLIVLHYLYGLPFKRIESLHKAWGIPFADANQWQVANESMALMAPLFKALVIFAIRNILTLRMDDTGSMILTIKRQIAAELAAAKALGIPEDTIRTGINASGFYIETPAGVVLLYFTGRHHAAEILRELLRHRLPGSPKITKVTDGASKNFDPELADMLEEGTCNTHAFLKFYDVKDQFPAEYAVVGEAYDKIYEVEEQARAGKLSPEQRLLIHQQQSRPWMIQIREMCEDKIERGLVEPRSPLWQPVHFIINQWPRLTKFLEVAGMPLDTNLCEQALIAPVRYLAASFNYHTARGAETGDHGMSLGATARANGVDPVAWYTDCLANHQDLAQNPDKYFPWAYRERIEVQKLPPDTPQPPTPTQ